MTTAEIIEGLVCASVEHERWINIHTGMIAVLFIIDIIVIALLIILKVGG